MKKKQNEITKGFNKLSQEALQERHTEIAGEIKEAKKLLSSLFLEQQTIEQIIVERGRRQHDSVINIPEYSPNLTYKSQDEIDREYGE